MMLKEQDNEQEITRAPTPPLIPSTSVTEER